MTRLEFIQAAQNYLADHNIEKGYLVITDIRERKLEAKPTAGYTIHNEYGRKVTSKLLPDGLLEILEPWKIRDVIFLTRDEVMYALGYYNGAKDSWIAENWDIIEVLNTQNMVAKVEVNKRAIATHD